MNVSKLIVMVEKYPELYNMRHPEYFNNVRRDNIWEEISATMKQSNPFLDGKIFILIQKFYTICTQQIFGDRDRIKDFNLPRSCNMDKLKKSRGIARAIFTKNCNSLETLLGWTVMGKVDTKFEDIATTKTLISMFIKEADISDLWNLDLIGIKEPSDHKAKEDKDLAVKQFFLETTIVNQEGRYEVSLPWTNDHPPLPSNNIMAEKRLFSVVKRLKENKMFHEYDMVFKQWVQDGIIEVVPINEINEVSHYLPHRPVIKESSCTTRIRPVFDASAKEKLLPSLNDCLESGPNLIENIPNVLLRFREGRYGVIADIAKAFLQISVNPSERNYLRFLWASNENVDEILVYRHKRIVFGVKCSPFLLGAVIEVHLQKYLEKDISDTEAIEKLKKSFYVDNVSTSFDSREEADRFMDYATNVMAKGKFDLRSWEITGNYCDENFSESRVLHVLGINWDSKNDLLFINCDFLKGFNPLPLTKKKMLSIAHQIFDPIGFASPITLVPKLLLQKTWKKKIAWDSEVDDDILKEFLEWFKYLRILEEIKIPRWIGKKTTGIDSCTLHTFCDGSKRAYATVIYLRVVCGNEVNIQLVSAKSRVVPIKDISIPRIELLAATVGARLTKHVKNAMSWSEIASYFWTDSTTVIAWIKQTHSNWKVFVQNRVIEIRQLTQIDQWNFVPGTLNPADLPSRGCNAKQLLESKWHEGPYWLKNDSIITSKFNFYMNNDEVFAERAAIPKDTTCFVLNSPDVKPKISEWCTHYFSKYLKIVRLVAWIYRFINNCKSEEHLRHKEDLTLLEIEEAEVYLFKLIQEETLTGIKDKKVATLNPIMDDKGLIRLETKLYNKEDTYSFRYPIVLSADNKIVKSLIIHYHEKNCHAGVEILMSILRENYWILGGRKALRSIISKCISCKRQKARKLNAKEEMLPSNRLRESAVFEIIGTDFAGPIYLKTNQKAWFCLFTCAVYRAIHLELVTSLSTEAFLQAFRRFIARRGRPRIVYSDNGTNYAGTSNMLKGIDWKEIGKYSSAHHIEWKFNPPSAAWWGGWWERLVRLTKELMRRVLGKACLTYEEMITVLCDCESVINSRPLTYVSESEADLMPLTPNHFLHDLKYAGVPDIDQIEGTNLNRRQKYLQNLRDDIRKRFRKEYLGQLVQRSKPNVKYEDIKVGDVVLMECENKKRIDWPLALVIEKLPDKRGITRLVKIKTANATLLRPIQKLYPLEVSAKEVSLPLRSEDCKPKKTVKPDFNDKSNEAESTEKEKTSRCGRLVKVPRKYTLMFE